MDRLIRFPIVFLFSVLRFSVPAVARNPVVVELFTSEGCSSCPPADAVLVQLSHEPEQNGAELILLGEHVDYWNYSGWTDRFSSPQFSRRQSNYATILHLASVYTPQMVIDGRIQFVGNDAAEVRRKIEAAAQDPKPAHVALRWEGIHRLQVNVQSPTKLSARVLLAITEDGLSTTVGAGENSGRTLHHAAVVQRLQPLGSVEEDVFKRSIDIVPQTGWDSNQLKAIVLVQDLHTRTILGASEIPDPASSVDAARDSKRTHPPGSLRLRTRLHLPQCAAILRSRTARFRATSCGVRHVPEK